MAVRDLALGDRIELYLDHPALGCGYRAFSIAKVGRKWLTLLYLPTLATIEPSAG